MTEANGRIAGLVLAAGSSSRLGRPKQLLPVDGVPLVRRAALAALNSSCERVFIVVGANRTAVIRAIADLNVEIICNRGWQEGIGGSVRTGIGTIGRTPDYDAALLMLVDQIRIDSEHLESLIAAFRRHQQIAASGYDSILGVPALFPRRYFGELRQLRGDSGAKGLLGKYASSIVSIPCPEASVDVDTPADASGLYFFDRLNGD
jgi:molybdenum cofactor cytidylyltransferase